MESCSFYLESTPHSGPGEQYQKLPYFEWSPSWQIIFSQFLTSHLEVYIWHIFSDIRFWHSIWHCILTSDLAFFLASILTFSLIRALRSGARGWGLLAPTEARQCPLSSGAGSCDPRPNKEGRNEGRKEKVPLIKSRDRHLAGWELTSRIKQIAKQINRHEEKKKHIAPQRLAYSCCAIADFVSLETQGSQICTFPWKTILCKKRQERDKTKNGI